MNTAPSNSESVRVASFEILSVSDSGIENDLVQVDMRLRRSDGSEHSYSATAAEFLQAAAELVSQVCVRPVRISYLDSSSQIRLVVQEQDGAKSKGRTGFGRYLSAQSNNASRSFEIVVAALRAASHAGLLNAEHRANNQKVFRGWSSELCEELRQAFDAGELPEQNRLEAEGLILEQLNRVASAAVLTAANYPKPDSILTLFDTSAWLFDAQGRRRDAYTDTELWLAWYPGIENEDQTVEEVIESMPRSPPAAIPWIVRLFENPKSWIRFRGAVDLEDHDVLHVLLGRGLQDQDEAFVIGFAMGTAKRVSWFQYYVFKFVLARLYPEPYRIPAYLQPAFDLGVRCGQETGARNLYRQELKQFRSMTVQQARETAGIDPEILKRYYELEQQRIPSTIASLRLP